MVHVRDSIRKRGKYLEGDGEDAQSVDGSTVAGCLDVIEGGSVDTESSSELIDDVGDVRDGQEVGVYYRELKGRIHFITYQC